MPLPKQSSRYPDIRQTLDFAIANNGARYTLKASGKATHWRMRAYYFRKLLFNELNAANIGPTVGTPYDGVILKIDPADPKTVIIEINSAERTGTLTTLDGTMPTKLTDPFEAEALRFIESLKGLNSETQKD